MRGDEGRSRVRRLQRIARDLSRELAGLRWSRPVTHVYDPLVNAWRAHARYLSLHGGRPGRVLLLGMNPGPYGMAQTGVPFGDPVLVREFVGVEERVQRPAAEHPKRPVLGFDSPRREVSGQRLWGWARDRFGSADRFFRRFFVGNYCPLSFMEASGRNRTPDKLPAPEREAVHAACDRALVRTVETLEPTRVVGIGAFAEGRARAALATTGLPIGRILHPSPASPAANRGWAEAAEAELRAQGVALAG